MNYPYQSSTLSELLELAPMAHRFTLWVRANPWESLEEFLNNVHHDDDQESALGIANFPWSRVIPGLGSSGIHFGLCGALELFANGRLLGRIDPAWFVEAPKRSVEKIAPLVRWAEFRIGVGERFLLEQYGPAPDLGTPVEYVPGPGISPEAAALLDVLNEHAGVKRTGKELVASLANRKPPVYVDEKRISGGLVPELRKAGIPITSKQGSPGYSLAPVSKRPTR